MKDIFIDNCIAKNFTNPMDNNYKKLIDWLMKYEKDSLDNAYLVVSNKLLKEYDDSAKNCFRGTSIPVIISKLTIERRIIKKSNQEIEDFMKKYFTKKILRNLRSNEKDRYHIPIILLSNRKMALTNDDNFTFDLSSFPGYNVIVSDRPETLSYE